MDDTVNRLAKELADAMADAVASDPRVEACRARAREAGYDLRVTLDAEIGFAAAKPARQEGGLAAARSAPRATNDTRR